MISIVQQTLDFIVKNDKKPDIHDIDINDKSLLVTQGFLFVTFYKNGIIRGSAGNMRYIEDNKATELINNTFEAINDKRFNPINISELKNLNIRIDEITLRNVIQDGDSIKKRDPLRKGIIAIKRDYKKMAIILPNISPLLITGEDFFPVLSNKLGEIFVEKNYFVYEIETKQTTNY